MKMKKTKAIVVKYLPVLLFLISWEGFSQTGIVPKEFLPSFSDVMRTWVTYLVDGDLIQHALASLKRETAGFLLSVILGVSLGIGMAQSKKVQNFFAPLVEITYPIPKPVLVPVLMIWLGIGDMSKITVILLGCILPVIISSFNGARGVDKYLIWSGRNMGTSKRKILWKVIIPAALPEILSGIRTALAMSFIMLVISEMLTARSGLGFLVFTLGESGVYDGLFAAVLSVTILGFSADRVYLFLMKRMLFWQEG